MANNKVKHYRTDVAGRKPEAKNMLDGEIAINLADKKIFTKFGDAVINIGNGADAVVEGGQTFTGKIKASDIESESNLKLKNADKSDIVFADEHDKAKARISSPAQTDSKGELRVTVAKGKATGESSDFVLNGNGQLSLPAAPVAPDSATRKDYVDSEISKVKTGSSADLTALEKKVNDNDTAINTKVDANKTDADDKIKAVNDRLTVDNQTLTNMINEKVNKSGDTMTGSLTVPSVYAAGDVYAGTLKVTPAGNNGDVLSIENHGRTSKTIHQIAYATDTDDRLLFRRDANEGSDALDLMTMSWGKTGRGMSVDIAGQARIGDVVTTPLMSVASNFAVGNSMGLNSIAIGDSDTGLKWLGDGLLGMYSNGRNVMNTENGYMQMNRLLNTRYVNDEGNGTTTPPSGTSLIRNETWTDGNGIGDGNTHIGLVADGKYNHYLRGAGRTFIDTHEGLGVMGPASFYQTIYNNKSYGSYDFESLPTWTDPAYQSNHLRKLRAKNGGAIFHEAVVAEHGDSRASQSISWYHGNGPENFIASMQIDGTINATRFNTSAEYEAINLKTKGREAAYIRGTDGDKTSWLFGRLNPGDNRLIARSTIDQDGSSTVDLELDSGSKYFGVNVGGNRIARFHEKNIIIDGRKWAADNSHAWADQWNQLPPVAIEFGAVPAASDYYPGYALQSSSVGFGYSTRFELGMIRAPADQFGKGILRVGTYEEGASKRMANYEFDIDGRFAVPGKINTPYVETDRLTSFGVHTNNLLGGNSIAFGDQDTGIRQRFDGNLEIITDSLHLATFNPSGLTINDRMISVNAPNNSRGIYVGNVRTGNANAMIQGQVDGWADWGAWRDRPAGMTVEAPTRSKCINIWKHVHWGTEWGAAMDVYNPDGAGPEAQLHVGGANYHFSGNGTANAISWVSTSDKRLKSNFEEIENAVDKVEKLTGYVYDKKSDLVETEYSFEVREAGIIAQELQEVLPEAVSSFGPDEILGVNSAAVNALLVNAIKELSARVKELEAK
ncbi:tail fiber domain-containing protein [Citrobacter sp. Cpo113]|uniref:tail fiber domain-containing protein n=1 Tax=Citrobacter sp. Cpo113 TaxID=2985146 RepID=UPI0025756F91|nr:tail fiber domain-containing protein [Citrobacter sp. Cpo113]MDM2788104.1 tail fiber domain-containing protein [Citrobacter sp. Cpo113]